MEAVVSKVGTKFDAVFTNAALHWCKRDPAGVLESAKRVLKPGGRIVGEMGGFMNCIGAVSMFLACTKLHVLTRRRQGIRSALHRVLRERGHDPESVDPWYFPSMEDYVKVSDHLLQKTTLPVVFTVLVRFWSAPPLSLLTFPCHRASRL